ncbi:MAG: 2,3-bisphosphoglycerate-independent phosphoglycerate mutase [Rickettsiales bacterium]|jgi:2,3-bisphosphoglycerate-independent phosphoglycerate mutase|nr:2,3-bisphosphoglycerate-independent phosphoglycerate mutase [Rickettsiales bacterium]
MTKPLVLCILDGVGIASASPHNPVTAANMPFYHGLLDIYPHATLNASGAAVGLIPGTMGNSEVGHITIGAGRIVNQFLRRFQIESESGRLPGNPQLQKFIADVKKDSGIVHLIGMVSDGRVHSDIAQQIEIARIVLGAGLKICVHFISDGRDTPPQSATKYANELILAFADDIDAGRMWFGTLCGRYYAMDRNNNFDRTQLAFDAIATGNAEFSAPDILGAITDAYARGETDEFIKPTAIFAPDASNNKSRITNHDGVLFANYRSDRARQILKFIMMPNMPGAQRPENFTAPHMLCFSQYGEGLDELCPALLPDVPVYNTLGDILAANGMSQLRIAETEKYNHVTFFFDAERTIDYPREEKILIPSPAVATFDLAPEMSAAQITDALLPRLSEFDVVILNYANGDMIGHTGIEPAAAKALQILDAQLARLVPAVLANAGTILITADHGNVEKMWNEELKTPWTAHTTNLVPFILIGTEARQELKPKGNLSDIAPTMLKILNIPQPLEMTGKSLID